MLLGRTLTSRSVKMSSILTGQSGRIYMRGKLLQAHPMRSEFDIYRASSGGKQYVLKYISLSILDLLKEVNDEFSGNSRLRLHIDHNDEKQIVVYEYFRADLLALVQNSPELSIQIRKTILREVGLALRDMHSKNWIHLDVKPNNIMIEWDSRGLQKVALGDIGCASKLVDNKPLNAMMGNVMWRSPEGQIGKGIGKPSEVFSFGLLCFYVITCVEWLHLNFDNLETEPEPVISCKLLTAFGPLPNALVSHIDNEYGGALLNGLWEAIKEEELCDPLKGWPQEKFTNLDLKAKNLILRMTDLDPARRVSISEVMEDPYWNAVEDLNVVGAEGSTKD